jgi:hypothetical protein
MSYLEGIRAAYEGELIGERLYREVARRREDVLERAKLDAIANVERLTNRRLRLIAVRLGVEPIERRTQDLAELAWPEFIARAVREWPPYIARFAALEPLAPAGDAVVIRQLVDHEVVLVEFAQMEQSAMGSVESLQVLHSYLERSASGE